MAREHIVVDGSNIATEGRSAPSLAQLEEAVAELRREHGEAEVTVIVDATFSHRIDQSELARFEEEALKGEYVHPPAGAIGRGDAFLLRIAEKVDATVLSNDSFQEFHGEHPWLFERGRLLGATPVPGVGWIFSPRTPVRGPKSRRAVEDSKADDKAKRKISKAIEAATKEAVAPRSKGASKQKAASSETGSSGGSRRQQSSVTTTAAAVNDPLTFISFIAGHPLGTQVTGEVESYTSHGAVVMVDGTQCYLPLANMAVPAPRSAREVLKKGEKREFVVTALDPQRRGVEVAMPGVAVVSGRPSEETIAAELAIAKKKASPRSAKKAPAKKAVAKRAPAKKAVAKRAAKKASPSSGGDEGDAPEESPARARTTEEHSGTGEEKAPAKKAPKKQAGAKRAKKAAPPAEEAAPAVPSKKAPAKKAPAKKAPAKKVPAKKAAKKSAQGLQATEAELGGAGPRRSPRSRAK